MCVCYLSLIRGEGKCGVGVDSPLKVCVCSEHYSPQCLTNCVLCLYSVFCHNVEEEKSAEITHQTRYLAHVQASDLCGMFLIPNITASLWLYTRYKIITEDRNKRVQMALKCNLSYSVA